MHISALPIYDHTAHHDGRVLMIILKQVITTSLLILSFRTKIVQSKSRAAFHNPSVIKSIKKAVKYGMIPC